MRGFILVLRFILPGILAGGCGAPETGSTADSAAASREPQVTATHYQLVGVDTLPLPDPAACGASIATAGDLMLRDDRTWRASERAHYTCSQPPSVATDSGTFEWVGDSLQLRSLADPGSGGEGLRQGDTLRVTFGVDAMYVYVRRPGRK
jgi:hypothetical protein